MTQTDLVRAWLRQQLELGMPDFITSHTVHTAMKTAAHCALASKAAPATDSASPSGSSSLLETFEQKRAALKELYYTALECDRCRLGAVRNTFVFGGGNAAAPLLIIGEAPGEEEDRQGLPFVGAAGELLDKMLEAIDLERKKHAFITNVLKCRPPANRNPESSEICACSDLLLRQIEIISPKALLLLGRIAAQELLKTSESIGKLRSRIHTYNGIPAVATYHPAALLRNPSYKRPAWEDLQKLQELLREIGVYGDTTG